MSELFYHATVWDNWYERAVEGDWKVHVGTDRAAVERVREYTAARCDETFTLWELAVDEATPLWPTIEVDEYLNKRFIDRPEAVQYRNFYEDSGSLSLYVRARDLIPVTVWAGRLQQDCLGFGYSATFDLGTRFDPSQRPGALEAAS